MPNKLLFCLVIFSFLQSAAQENEFHPDECSNYYVKPDAISISSTLPCSKVTVIDRRFDTSKLGYARPSAFVISMIKTKKPFTEAIAETISKSTKKKLSGNLDNNLLVVVRHLWLEGQPANAEYRSSCTAALEVYFKTNDFYIPLFKIDTVFLSIKPLLKDPGSLLSTPFEFCLNKLQALPIEKIMSIQKRVSQEEINAFYMQNFDQHRIINDSLVKGVYLTFNDFLNNKPSYTDFTIATGEVADELYIRQNGQETILDNFWGFCDGEKKYIRLRFNFFELHRQNNTFDLYGTTSLDHPFMLGGNARTPESTVLFKTMTNMKIVMGKNKLAMKAMQLNMETGKPYGF